MNSFAEDDLRSWWRRRGKIQGTGYTVWEVAKLALKHDHWRSSDINIQWSFLCWTKQQIDRLFFVLLNVEPSKLNSQKREWTHCENRNVLKNQCLWYLFVFEGRVYEYARNVKYDTEMLFFGTVNFALIILSLALLTRCFFIADLQVRFSALLRLPLLIPKRQS